MLPTKTYHPAVARLVRVVRVVHLLALIGPKAHAPRNGLVRPYSVPRHRDMGPSNAETVRGAVLCTVWVRTVISYLEVINGSDISMKICQSKCLHFELL